MLCLFVPFFCCFILVSEPSWGAFFLYDSNTMLSVLLHSANIHFKWSIFQCNNYILHIGMVLIYSFVVLMFLTLVAWQVTLFFSVYNNNLMSVDFKVIGFSPKLALIYTDAFKLN